MLNNGDGKGGRGVRLRELLGRAGAGQNRAQQRKVGGGATTGASGAAKSSRGPVLVWGRLTGASNAGGSPSAWPSGSLLLALVLEAGSLHRTHQAETTWKRPRGWTVSGARSSRACLQGCLTAQHWDGAPAQATRYPYLH